LLRKLHATENMASYLKCYKSKKKETLEKTVIPYGALHVDETVMQNKKLQVLSCKQHQNKRYALV
jgi:hypothetical protein